MATVDGYDGVLLGAGHNTLILQAYLGRAGLKTVRLERRARSLAAQSPYQELSKPPQPRQNGVHDHHA